MKKRINRKIPHSWHKKRRKSRASFNFKIFKSNLSKLRLPKIKFGKKRLAGAVVLALAVLGVYLAIFSGYFTIKNIIVSGNESIEKNKIEEAAQSRLSSKIYGFIPGNNLLFADKKKIAEKLAGDFSEIEKIEIMRKFPDKLEIAIKEKIPALIWCRTNCYFINNQGVAFLQADGQDAANPDRHFIKVIEEKDIAEEKQEGNPSDSESIATATAAKNENNLSPANDGDGADATVETASVEESDISSAISVNEQVSDENFISFAIDINNKIGYNSKLKIKYYKTKGTGTRELIAFTDKSTRIYFDTTQSAQKQADNLAEFLEKGIGNDKIDGIKYIYLKNDDRVFYK